MHTPDLIPLPHGIETETPAPGDPLLAVDAGPPPSPQQMATILHAAGVTRWHHNPAVPAETLGHHHGMVVQIVIWLAPPGPISRHLITAAAYHDVAELLVGDLAGPFKAAHPEFARAHSALEAEALVALGLGWALTPAEAAILKLADKLAAFAYVAATVPHLLATAEWQGAAAAIRAMAADLGDGPRVAALLEAITEPAGGAAAIV